VTGSLFITLAGISVLFILLLSLKHLVRDRGFCAICLSVSLTWLSLLALYHIGLFRDSIVIALLMGESIVGIFYLVESRIGEDLKLFRFPFLLTLTSAGYYALKPQQFALETIALLAGLWGFFLLLYVWRFNSSVRKLVMKAIECCKSW